MKYRTSLKVTETGEFGRYHVESQSSEKPYLVDLCERVDDQGRAHGRCNCVWFTTTANMNYRQNHRYVPYAVVLGNVRQEASECKHIAAARNHYHLHTTMPMLARMKEGVSEPQSTNQP